MEQNETIYTKKDVIENYKPMFTEWSLSKLIRQGKIKYIRIGRRIFITKQAVEEFIKEQQDNSIFTHYIEKGETK